MRFADRAAAGHALAAELRRRVGVYRTGRPPVAVRGRAVVLVDDGLATGSTVRAAPAALRAHEPARIVVAVPVGSPRVVAELAAEVDDLVCLVSPPGFRAVGQAYADFTPTSDDTVRAALAGTSHRPHVTLLTGCLSPGSHRGVGSDPTTS